MKNPCSIPCVVRSPGGAASSRLLQRGLSVLVVASLALPAAAQCTPAPAWSNIGNADADVTDVITLANGDVLIGGSFTSVGGVPANDIARFNGTTWSSLGSGMTRVGQGGWVTRLAQLPNGDIIAAGVFDAADGVPCQNIARFDGTAWHPLGAGLTGGTDINALVVLPTGHLVVGGWFTLSGTVSCGNFARWDGTSWLPVAAVGNTLTERITDMALLPSGEVIAVGGFFTPGGVTSWRASTWNSGANTWSDMTGLGGSPLAVLVRPDGTIVVSGALSSTTSSWTGNMATWFSSPTTGSGWAPFPVQSPAAPRAMAVLPNGDLLAATLLPMPIASTFQRFNGTSWQQFDPVGSDGEAYAMTLLPNGDVVAGGTFTVVNGVAAQRVARLSSTCAANAVAVPTACIGIAGPVTSTALSFPWCGTTVQIKGEGMLPSPAGLVMSVLGFGTQNVPLSQLSPVAQPNCFLLVTTDSTSLIFPQGDVFVPLTIPNNPAFAGTQVFHQFLHSLMDTGTGAQLSFESSNRLDLTIGAY